MSNVENNILNSVNRQKSSIKLSFDKKNVATDSKVDSLYITKRYLYFKFLNKFLKRIFMVPLYICKIKVLIL